MTTTTDEFAKRLRNVTPTVVAEMKRGVGRASFEVKKSVQTRMSAAAGGDLRLSNVGVRGARIGVRYDISGAVNPTSLVRAFGPAHLIEGDTKPHAITPKLARRRRSATKARALATPYGTFGSVNHPGTRGKHPWRRGVDAARPAVQREVGDAFRRAVRAGLRIS